MENMHQNTHQNQFQSQIKNTVQFICEYSLAEETANSIIHGVGILLSIVGLTILVAYSALYGNVWHVVSSSIYGATLILLYTASTLYHGIPLPKAKEVLQQIDHAAIYLLIAGTYTPFTLVTLRGAWGWTLFFLVWGIALLGVTLVIFKSRHLKKISLVLYLSLGWLILIAIKPMLENVATGGLILLLIGGLCYSIGSIFYVLKRCSFNHAIWHGFVLAGSIFQFFSILYYVVPGSV